MTGVITGGTWCRFYAGAPSRSVEHLAYISREAAVVERERGTMLLQLPADVIRPFAASYDLLRASLLAYAWTRGQVEQAKQGTAARTHYRAIVSFERDVGTPEMLAAVSAWLGECLPNVRVAAFLHRNTPYPHVHAWIEARDIRGRKLHLSAREYRQLDECWNRHYAPLVGREVREHVAKKWRTEREKQIGRNSNERNRENEEKEKQRHRLGNVRARDNAPRMGRGQSAAGREGAFLDRDQPLFECGERATATRASEIRASDNRCRDEQGGAEPITTVYTKSERDSGRTER